MKQLEFTPLEFETTPGGYSVSDYNSIRIYSVGVWNFTPEFLKIETND